MDTPEGVSPSGTWTRHQIMGQLCAALIAHTPPPSGDKERVAWRQDLVAEASQITDMVLADDGTTLPQPLMLPASVADCLRPAVRGQPAISWTLGADAHGRALRDAWDMECPHLLVAGKAGSGKSTVLDVALCQMLHNNHPDDLKVWLVGSEERFGAYGEVAHVERFLNTSLTVTDLRDVAELLADAVAKMEAREAAMLSHPSKPKTFTEAAALARGSLDGAALPSERLLIVMEECSNYLHRPRRDDERNIKIWGGIVSDIEKIARNSRSRGMHMMIATQYATKENIPATLRMQCRRIGLRTVDVIGSYVIIDQAGLERVKAPGSGFYDQREGSGPVAFSGLWLSPDGRDAIIAHLPRRPDSPDMASMAA